MCSHSCFARAQWVVTGHWPCWWGQREACLNRISCRCCLLRSNDDDDISSFFFFFRMLFRLLDFWGAAETIETNALLICLHLDDPAIFFWKIVCTRHLAFVLVSEVPADDMIFLSSSLAETPAQVVFWWSIESARVLSWFALPACIYSEIDESNQWLDAQHFTFEHESTLIHGKNLELAQSTNTQYSRTVANQSYGRLVSARKPVS